MVAPYPAFCYVRHDMSSGKVTCLTHGLEFDSGEEARKHIERMYRWWAWRYHPFKTLLDKVVIRLRKSRS